jgi:hypothetical protein
MSVSDQHNWLQNLISDAAEKNLCTQIHCTTCGAMKFRNAFSKLSRQNANGESTVTSLTNSIIQALRQIPYNADHRWIQPMRFVIYELNKLTRNQNQLCAELEGCWAGDILKSMILHYQERLEATAAHEQFCSPEAANERKAKEREQRKIKHEERLKVKQQRDIKWRLEHPQN